MNCINFAYVDFAHSFVLGRGGGDERDLVNIRNKL